MEFQTVTYPVIPTRDYTAIITKCEPVEGAYYPQMRWFVDLGDVEDMDGVVQESMTLWYHTRREVSRNNNLGKLAAACGWDADQGVPLNSDDIVGRTVTVTVVIARRADGSAKNTIAEVRKPGRKATAPAPVMDGETAGETAGDRPF